eukprot:TRINITY_DN108986_c0_g1_i1.p1 TRINITY_DN108986_c0_g1~~TRINITY_DN108986_c0_g1_i1.p1  ORF type:complete len:309 (-),score=39.04 TRINITY_DN108986_c0_g1_i1:652-1578(-)
MALLWKGRYFDPCFKLTRIATARGEIRLRIGGNGPALLLLHGNPQTHSCWHAVANCLQDRFTLVMPDLPGYGGSFKPLPETNHFAHCKRAFSEDMLDVMRKLGFDSDAFFVAGHDRGGRVAHRLALDHPGKVKSLATLDIVPTLHHFENVDMDFAMGYYHWFWLAQPKPFPENLINADTLAWFQAHCSREPKDLTTCFNQQALEDYLEAITDPSTIEAICEDYRAAATIDLDHDRESRSAGNKIACPLLALWGAKGNIGKWYDPLSAWQAYSRDGVHVKAINAGHFVPEEAPEEVALELEKFFIGIQE